MATGQDAPWRGRRTTRTSWQKYFPPNWAPIPDCWETFRISSSRSRSRNPRPRSLPDVGQCVEVAGRGQLGRLQCVLGRRAADDEGQMVRRAGRGAQKVHLGCHEVEEALGVEQRLGLLEEVALVGRAATLGHEQQLVGRAVDGGDLDLCRKVGAGVLLAVHVERRHLGVAQVGGLVGVEDAPRDGGLVTPAGHDELALLALHDGRTGVLARREHPAGRDVGVAEQVEGDEAVVAGGLGVIQDRRELSQVAGAQEVGDLAHGLRREEAQRLVLHFQERPQGSVDGGHALGREQAVGGGVLSQREEVLVRELGHGPKVPPPRRSAERPHRWVASEAGSGH